MITAITNARVFDGECVIDEQTVVVDQTQIAAVGGGVPGGATIVDARGGTLLPGLIDSHTHTSLDSLRYALAFGVTTELEMQGHWTPAARKEVAERDDVADVRSAGLGITPPGGHPTELVPDDVNRSSDGKQGRRHQFPFTSTPEQAAKIIAKRVAEGSDYIKIMVEDGTVFAHPGLPCVSDKILTTAVREAHRHNKMAITHTMTLDSTRRAINAGVDGLAHLFIDGPHTPDVVAAIAASGAFVTATIGAAATVMGKNESAAFGADERVRAKLSEEWLDALCNGSINTYPQGNLADVLGSVAALHAAGVDILAGSDVSVPVRFLGGSAHGASLHHELQLLVKAGLTPIEALRAATSVPARRFGLTDRGRIFPGARADLLLVDGDPTTAITDTLSTRAVWRRGTRQPSR